MTYLIIEIFLFILLAGLVGFAIAWWIFGRTGMLARHERDTARAHLAAATGRLNSLTAQCADCEAEKAALQEQAAASRREAELLRRDLQTANGNIEILQREVAVKQRALEDANSQSSSSLSALAGASAVAARPAATPASAPASAAPTRTASAQIAPAQTASAAEPVAAYGLATASAGKPDDLKRISGVGPKLEGTLNDLGIFYFRQIAAWTEADIATVDDKLIFKGRIQRDDWVGQAKILGEGGETDFSKRYSDD